MKKQTWKRNALQASLTLAAALGMWGAASIGVERAMANDEAAVETEATLDAFSGPAETVGPPAIEAPSVGPSEVPPSASSNCEECDEYCYQLVREPYFPWRSYYVKRPKKSEAERLADVLRDELPDLIVQRLGGELPTGKNLSDEEIKQKADDFYAVLSERAKKAEKELPAMSEEERQTFSAGRAMLYGMGDSNCVWSGRVTKSGVDLMKDLAEDSTAKKGSVIAKAELALFYSLLPDYELKRLNVTDADIQKLIDEAKSYGNPFAEYAAARLAEKAKGADDPTVKSAYETAVADLQELGKVGDPIALMLLGMDKSKKENELFGAVARFERSANAFAKFELAKLAVEKDEIEYAESQYAEAAGKGLPEAQFAYAEMKMDGVKDGENVVVKADPTLAAQNYRLAADAGLVEAQFKFGRCAETGVVKDEKTGVAKVDWTTAMEYYKKASDAGHAEATYRLGLCYTKGFAEITALTAMTEEARWEAAEKLFETAAEKYPEAAYEVALYYLAKESEVGPVVGNAAQSVGTDDKGPATPVKREANYEEAIKWLEIAVYAKDAKTPKKTRREDFSKNAFNELVSIYQNVEGYKDPEKADALILLAPEALLPSAQVAQAKADLEAGKELEANLNRMATIAGFGDLKAKDAAPKDYKDLTDDEKAAACAALEVALQICAKAPEDKKAQWAEYAKTLEARFAVFADAGDVDAALRVGLSLCAGEKPDFAKAKGYLEKVLFAKDAKGAKTLNAEQTDAKARYELALCYVDDARRGKTEANWTDAETLLAAVAADEKAGDSRDQAALKLGERLAADADAKRKADGVNLLVEAASRGCVPAFEALVVAKFDETTTAEKAFASYVEKLSKDAQDELNKATEELAQKTAVEGGKLDATTKFKVAAAFADADAGCAMIAELAQQVMDAGEADDALAWLDFGARHGNSELLTAALNAYQTKAENGDAEARKAMNELLVLWSEKGAYAEKLSAEQKAVLDNYREEAAKDESEAEVKPNGETGTAEI